MVRWAALLGPHWVYILHAAVAARFDAGVSKPWNEDIKTYPKPQPRSMPILGAMG